MPFCQPQSPQTLVSSSHCLVSLSLSPVISYHSLLAHRPCLLSHCASFLIFSCSRSSRLYSTLGPIQHISMRCTLYVSFNHIEATPATNSHFGIILPWRHPLWFTPLHPPSNTTTGTYHHPKPEKWGGHFTAH